MSLTFSSCWMLTLRLMDFFSDGPSVSIKLGEPLDLNNIEEGHDVYFTCKIDSNPSPKIVDWNYNVSITFKHTYYGGKCLVN